MEWPQMADSVTSFHLQLYEAACDLSVPRRRYTQVALKW